MFLLPVRTDRRLRRIPWFNGALIAANVVVFMFTGQRMQAASWLIKRGFPLETVEQKFRVLGFYLMPEHPQLHQFISYQFLHSDWMHLLGNMLFLYVFGNSVEDRLGRVGYLSFYLAGGVIAGLGHVLLDPNAVPVIGASGAVAAVTGAYLALFPLSYVTIMLWFLVPLASFEVSSVLLILFRVAQDLVFQLLGIGSVAYLAHLSGYVFGFATGMSLLLMRLLARERYDLLALIEHQRRRVQFRRLARAGHQPWEHAAATHGADPVAEECAGPPAPDPQRHLELRARISQALAGHDVASAAQLYGELVKAEPGQVMGQQQQLDLANQFMADGRYHTAATAYELFLSTYHRYPQKQKVQLILGLIYARYLDQPQRAKELLSSAVPQLKGEDQALARQVLSQIGLVEPSD